MLLLPLRSSPLRGLLHLFLTQEMLPICHQRHLTPSVTSRSDVPLFFHFFFLCCIFSSFFFFFLESFLWHFWWRGPLRWPLAWRVSGNRGEGWPLLKIFCCYSLVSWWCSAGLAFYLVNVRLILLAKIGSTSTKILNDKEILVISQVNYRML